MMDKDHEQSDRREFFRISGTLYLHFKVKENPSNISVINPHHPPETLDRLSLELMHLKQKIDYESNDEPPRYLKELLDITKKIQDAFVNQKSPQIYKRKSVVISGANLEFISVDEYQPSTLLDISMAFLEYPFATIHTDAKVLRSEKLKSQNSRFRTVVTFENISEEDRDQIVKFVNHQQRKILNKRKKELSVLK